MEAPGAFGARAENNESERPLPPIQGTGSLARIRTVSHQQQSEWGLGIPVGGLSWQVEGRSAVFEPRFHRFSTRQTFDSHFCLRSSMIARAANSEPRRI